MHPTSPDLGPALPDPPELNDAPAPSGARRALLLGALAAPVAAQWPAGAAAAPVPAAPAGLKVLRVLFNSAESSFDPVHATDLYSATVLSHIFESLYGYDPLARPSLVQPRLADGLPEVSADFKVWTVKLRRGICFADDPAF